MPAGGFPSPLEHHRAMRANRANRDNLALASTRLTKNLDEKGQLAQRSARMPIGSPTPPPLLLAGGLILAVAAGCASRPQRKPLEMEPIGTVPNITRTPEDDGEGATTTPNAGTSAAGGTVCSGADFDALEEALKQCESPMPKNADLPTGLRDKLEVKVTGSSPTIVGGGRVDVTVVFRNKSNEPLPLYFTGDPAPRFDIEARDSRGRRVDVPPGRQPAWPKGTGPKTFEVKAAKIVLDKGGTARVRVGWDAVKMKWAPDKARSWDGHGYPRVPSGSLSKGKYTLTVKLPVLGIYEQNVDIPKLAVEVGS
jgi:hypothetical protein